MTNHSRTDNNSQSYMASKGPLRGEYSFLCRKSPLLRRFAPTTTAPLTQGAGLGGSLAQPLSFLRSAFAPTQTVVCADANGRLRVRKRLKGRTYPSLSWHLSLHPLPGTFVLQRIHHRVYPPLFYCFRFLFGNFKLIAYLCSIAS